MLSYILIHSKLLFRFWATVVDSGTEVEKKDSMRTLLSAVTSKAEVYIDMQTYMLIPELKFVMYQQGVFNLVRTFKL